MGTPGMTPTERLERRVEALERDVHRITLHLDTVVQLLRAEQIANRTHRDTRDAA